SFRRSVACSRSAPICVPTPRPSTRRRWHRIFPWPMPRNRISSSAPGANSASPISWSGSSPTPNFISPSVTGRTSLREISTRRSNGIVRGSVDSVAPAPNWPVRPELTRDRIGGGFHVEAESLDCGSPASGSAWRLARAQPLALDRAPARHGGLRAVGMAQAFVGGCVAARGAVDRHIHQYRPALAGLDLDAYHGRGTCD